MFQRDLSNRLLRPFDNSVRQFTSLHPRNSAAEVISCTSWGRRTAACGGKLAELHLWPQRGSLTAKRLVKMGVDKLVSGHGALRGGPSRSGCHGELLGQCGDNTPLNIHWRKLDWNRRDLLSPYSRELAGGRHNRRATQERLAPHERRDELRVRQFWPNVEGELIDGRVSVELRDPDLVQIRPQVSVHDLTSVESRLPARQVAQVDSQRADATTRVRLNVLQPHECSLASPLTGVDNLIVANEDVTESPSWPSVLFLGIFPHAANILSLVSRRIVLGSPAAASALRPPAAATSGTCQMCGFSSPSVPPIEN